MRYVPKEYSGKPNGTLCWYCANSVPNIKKNTGCSWSKSFIPVDGWEAIPVTIPAYGKKSDCESYCVCRCPQFEDENMRVFDKYMEFYSMLEYEEGELIGGTTS